MKIEVWEGIVEGLRGDPRFRVTEYEEHGVPRASVAADRGYSGEIWIVATGFEGYRPEEVSVVVKDVIGDSVYAEVSPFPGITP